MTMINETKKVIKERERKIISFRSCVRVEVDVLGCPS